MKTFLAPATAALAVIACSVAALLALPAAATAYPPATIGAVTQDSFTVGGLDCGTQYRLTIEERNAANTGWESLSTLTPSTAACTTSPPTADFTITPEPAIRTLPTTFTSTGTCPQAPCTYRWLHGDAASTDPIGTGPIGSFTYVGPAGTRTVTLRVTDAAGREAVRTRSFVLANVGAASALSATATAAAAAYPPATISNVTQTSLTVGGLDCGTQYRLTIDERNSADTGWQSPSTFTPTTAACAPASPPPTAAFTIAPDPAVVGLPTTFTSTGSCPEAPCSYAWLHDTAGAQFGTGAVATVTYAGSAGTRTVTLRVTDADGRVDTETRTFQLVNPPTPPPTTTGFPGPGDTGDPTLGNNTAGPGITVKTAGRVIENVAVPWIDVQAPNVTIRNSVVGPSGLPIVSRSTGLTVEDTTVFGSNGTGIGWSNYTARRIEVYGNENGFNAGNNVVIEDSWIHDLNTSGGAHTDGIQFTAGSGNVVIRHNNIDPVPGNNGATSPIIMHTGTDPQNHDVWIENNRLDGGGSSVALYCPRRPAERIYVNNNRMLKGVYGSYTDSCRPGTTITQYTGNVDALTGALIPGSLPPLP